MNRALLLCALLLIATGAMAQASRVDLADPQTWKTYTIKNEQFSVSLPTVPELRFSRDSRPPTQKERSGRHMKTVLDGVTYAVDIIENSAAQSLDDLIAEYKAAKDFEPASEHRITVNGVAGKEYSTAAPPPARVQFFATPSRFYRFIAIGGNADNAAVKHFFSSIVFGEKANGIKVSVGPGMPLETSTGERIYKGSEVDQKVRLIESPPPIYPDDARKLGARGVVVLQAVFSKTGRVVNIQVISPVQYGVTEACIAAAEKIKFIPAMKDGKNVHMYMQLEYSFN